MGSNRRNLLKRDQHFLMDERVLMRMADYADIRKDEKILEIGAGTGNLTSFLVENGGKVYAIEKDRDLFKMLEDKFSSSNCEIIYGDALKMDLHISIRSSQTSPTPYHRG